MINLELYISFILAVSLLAITPGPSVLLMTANSMDNGWLKSTGTIFGDLSANLIQIIIASAGLAAFLLASEELFQIMKWIGVGYLIIIGLKKLLKKKGDLEMAEAKKSSWKGLYLQGFFVSATNPKAILFLAAFFPVFIDTSLAYFPQILVLASTYLIIDGLSLLLYGIFASHLQKYLRDQQKQHIQNKIVGTLFIIGGLFFATLQKAK